MTMATTYERLVAAGAPQLADPYFYRLSEGPVGVRVEIRELYPLGGSRRVDAAQAIVPFGEPALDEVVEIARFMKRRLDARLAQAQTP